MSSASNPFEPPTPPPPGPANESGTSNPDRKSALALGGVIANASPGPSPPPNAETPPSDGIVMAPSRCACIPPGDIMALVAEGPSANTSAAQSTAGPEPSAGGPSARPAPPRASGAEWRWRRIPRVGWTSGAGTGV